MEFPLCGFTVWGVVTFEVLLCELARTCSCMFLSFSVIVNATSVFVICFFDVMLVSLYFCSELLFSATSSLSEAKRFFCWFLVLLTLVSVLCGVVAC